MPLESVMGSRDNTVEVRVRVRIPVSSGETGISELVPVVSAAVVLTELTVVLSDEEEVSLVLYFGELIGMGLDGVNGVIGEVGLPKVALELDPWDTIDKSLSIEGRWMDDTEFDEDEVW